MKTPEEHGKTTERHLDALEWYIEHPEAPLESNLRAFVNLVKNRLEEEERKESGQIALKNS